METEFQLLTALAWIKEVDDDPDVLELRLPRLRAQEFSEAELRDLVGGDGADIRTNTWDGFALAARVAVKRYQSQRHDLLAGRIMAYTCHARAGAGPTPLEVLDGGNVKARVNHLRVLGMPYEQFFMDWLESPYGLRECVLSDAWILTARQYDYTFTYSNLMLMRSIGTRVIDCEMPSDMYLRVTYAAWEGSEDVTWCGETYYVLARRQLSVATPIAKCSALEPSTLLSSCFLMSGLELSQTLTQLLEAGRQKGGVGISLANTVNVLPVMDLIAAAIRFSRTIDRERPLNVAVYLPVWHVAIMDLLDARIPKQDMTAYFPSVFTAVMVHDCFMEAVAADGEWHLFSPVDAYPLLVRTFAFSQQYRRLVAEGKAVRTVKARELFGAIVKSLLVSGTPYVVNADRVNLSTLQEGAIECSNLCAEVTLHSASHTTASCFLSSVALPRCFVNGQLQYRTVGYVANIATHLLTSLCDRTQGVDTQLRTVAEYTRAIGIGVQGLGDALQMLGLAYDSSEARQVAANVAAMMQYEAMNVSVSLVAEYGHTPAIRELHHDRWRRGLPATARPLLCDTTEVVTAAEWAGLLERVQRTGLANETLIAMMPTVTSAHVQGNSDGIETRVGNVVVKRSSSGDDTLVNPVLWELLKTRLGVSEFNAREATLVRDIVRADGSVANLSLLTSSEKLVFRTAFELGVHDQLMMAAAMAPYVDQSLSVNWFMKDATSTEVAKHLMQAWRLGLKTHVYYLRQATAIQSMSTLEAARPVNALPVTGAEMTRRDETMDENTVCVPGCTSCSA